MLRLVIVLGLCFLVDFAARALIKRQVAKFGELEQDLDSNSRNVMYPVAKGWFTAVNEFFGFNLLKKTGWLAKGIWVTALNYRTAKTFKAHLMNSAFAPTLKSASRVAKIVTALSYVWVVVLAVGLLLV